jgi:DNA-directed RNA polymerase subunit H (RpoH/RPB5)
MVTKEINVQQHILVPKHILMKDEEVQELLTRYNISLQQMPSISLKDPALGGLEVKSGQVIKIIRSSPTQGKSEYYRRVTE